MNAINKISLFIVMLILISGCKKEKNRICELYEKNVSYTVGTVKSLTYFPGKAIYKYSYWVNGNFFKEKEKAYGIGKKDESLIGNKYIVIYEFADPSNSDLNFDFPIWNETDYQEFITEFAGNPPPPDFPNHCK